VARAVAQATGWPWQMSFPWCHGGLNRAGRRHSGVRGTSRGTKTLPPATLPSDTGKSFPSRFLNSLARQLLARSGKILAIRRSGARNAPMRVCLELSLRPVGFPCSYL